MVARTAVVGDAPRMHASSTAIERRDNTVRSSLRLEASRSQQSRRPHTPRGGTAPADGDLVVLRHADGVFHCRQHLRRPGKGGNDRREADDAVHLREETAAARNLSG